MSEAEWALSETSEMLEALVQSSPLGIVVTDLKGNVRVWNPAAEALLRWSRDEVVGRPPPRVRPEEAAEFRVPTTAAARPRRVTGRAGLAGQPTPVAPLAGSSRFGLSSLTRGRPSATLARVRKVI